MQMNKRRHSSSVKMAAPLDTCIKEEQRSVIRFLTSEGVKHIQINHRIKAKCCDACLSQQQMYKWSRTFTNGVTPVKDSSKP
jgi:hypothetical protein